MVHPEKGYGFITPDEGDDDIFARFSAIAARGYRTLKENQRVEFDLVPDSKVPQFENIRPL